MRKVYTKNAQVAQINPGEFYEDVRKAVNNIQSAGLEAEIQYQTGQSLNTMYFTALILGYKMEEEC